MLLTGEIDDALAALVCAQLLVLASDDTCRDPVVLMINSPGGSVDAGFAIYDTMQTLGRRRGDRLFRPRRVDGSVPALRGHAGHAVRAPAQPDPHAPAARQRCRASPTDIRIHADHFARRRQEMAELIAQHTGQPVERVVADADRDHWFDADEALEYGMVDHIVDGPLRSRVTPAPRAERCSAATCKASFSSPR